MADSSSPLPRLSVLTGPLTGKELVLEEVVDNILIGADATCRFHLPLPGISPIHARIWMDAAGVTVYDTHSPRGLYVNDDRVSGQMPLKNGDILWLGTPGEEEAVMIQCRLPARRAAAPAPPPTAAPAPSPPAAEPDPESTMLIEAPMFGTEPEALELVEETAGAVPELEPLAEPGAEVTMAMAPAEAAEPPAESQADATAVMAAASEEPAPGAERDATLVGGADAFYIQDEEQTASMPALEEDPLKFAVDMPVVPEVSAAEPLPFEDETQEMASDVALAVPAAPVPVPAHEAEPEPAPPARPEPAPPRVVVPDPTPAPIPAPTPPRLAKPATVAPQPPRTRASSSGVGRYAALAAVGLLVLTGGGFVAWRLLQSKSAPATTPASTMAAVELPTTTLRAAPPPHTAPPATAPAQPLVEETVTIVRSPPPSAAPVSSPVPAAKPTPAPKAVAATPAPVSAEALRAQQLATQVASLLVQAKDASTARNFAGAAQFYEELLKLEPQNAQAIEGRGTAQAAALSLKKSFVAGKTTVRSGKAAKGPAGFESEDLTVAKAPDYSGRIEFEANPRNVMPGDSYAILVYLVNDGKKGFKLESASVTTAVNDAKSGGAIQTDVKDVESQQRVLLSEMPGVWQAGTTRWSVEVSIASSRGDSFRNVLTWK